MMMVMRKVIYYNWKQMKKPFKDGVDDKEESNFKRNIISNWDKYNLWMMMMVMMKMIYYNWKQMKKSFKDGDDDKEESNFNRNIISNWDK